VAPTVISVSNSYRKAGSSGYDLGRGLILVGAIALVLMLPSAAAAAAIQRSLSSNSISVSRSFASSGASVSREIGARSARLSSASCWPPGETHQQARRPRGPAGLVRPRAVRRSIRP